MSVIQRVIVLNKPFKIRGYTILQWLVMAVAGVLALIIATKMPKDMKIGGAPIGVFVFVAILGAGIAYVSATQMKPTAWWRNKFLYSLGVVPRVYLPKREEGYLYPDPSINEPRKREDQGYITVESDDEL